MTNPSQESVPTPSNWKHPLTVDWSKSVDHMFSIFDADGISVYDTNDKRLAEMFCEALKDAGRYRWLRASDYDISDVVALLVSRGMFMDEAAFDAAIDSAQQRQAGASNV